MAYYLREYLTEYVGTQFDVPLAEAYKHSNSGDFNKYNWLYYHKGALVSYLLDETIMGVTKGGRSLDDVLKVVYTSYGGFNGTVANADLVRILDSITAFHFDIFFDKFVYGAEKLPLKAKGEGLTVDWADLNSKLKVTETTITAATTSASYATTSVLARTTSSVSSSQTTVTSKTDTATAMSTQLVTGVITSETLAIAGVAIIVIGAIGILYLRRRGK
jgi:predicted metalloprotease with PDZ domain